MKSNYIDREKLKHSIVFSPAYNRDQILQLVDDEPGAPEDEVTYELLNTIVRDFLAGCVLSMCKICKDWNPDTGKCGRGKGKHICKEYPNCFKYKGDERTNENE